MSNEKNHPIPAEGVACPQCGMAAEHRVCSVCGMAAWVIDCGHYVQAAPVAAGKTDGSHTAEWFCGDCAEGGDGGDK